MPQTPVYRRKAIHRVWGIRPSSAELSRAQREFYLKR